MDDLLPAVRSGACIAIVLLAFALRLAPWEQNRFLEDEALYGYWGLQIATGADPMLDLEPVDKPPLHPYALALTFLPGLQPQPGGSVLSFETAARFPSLLASIASIALVYALGRDLFRDLRVGLLAALLLALSPFDILFASTAFTDSLMTAFVLAALLAASRHRLGLAGVLAGLAAATKQQGLLFVPLIVVAGSVSASSPSGEQAEGEPSTESRARRLFMRLGQFRWLRFAVGLGIMIGAVLWWDLAREQRPGFLEQSFISYGGLGPAEPRALSERAMEWLSLVRAFWVSPWFGILLAGAVAAWMILAAGQRTYSPDKIDWAVLIFFTAFLLLHWLIGFQVWDRYLLGLVPLAALLASRALVAVGDGFGTSGCRRLYAVGLGLAIAVLLAGPVSQATRSEFPLGGDHGAYDGIDVLAAYIREKVPRGAVLYHSWLGHHYRFYLYGAPLRLHWYPDLEDLVHDATVYRREPRYIAFPSWRESSPAEAALAAAGISLSPVLETFRRDGTVSFRLHRLEGP